MATIPSKAGTVNGAIRLPTLTLDRVLIKPTGVPARVGHTVSGAVRLPPLALDGEVAPRKSPVWLVVKLRYPTGISEEVVAEHAHRIVEAMKALDPELGLVYDRERSTEDAERRSVVVALSPTTFPLDLDKRLSLLLANGRKVEPKAPIVGVSVEWDQPVAA